MLVVKVEIWPGGFEDAASVIGEIKIANISNLSQISNYKFLVEEPPSTFSKGIKKSGKILEHNRYNSVWLLVYKVLKKVFET